MSLQIPGHNFAAEHTDLAPFAISIPSSYHQIGEITRFARLKSRQASKCESLQTRSNFKLLPTYVPQKVLRTDLVYWIDALHGPYAAETK